MAEDGAQAAVVSSDSPAPVHHGHTTAQPSSRTAAGDASMQPLEPQESPMSPRIHTPNPFSRHNTSLDLDDYFVGYAMVHSELTVVNQASERSTGHSAALKVARLPADAW